MMKFYCVTHKSKLRIYICMNREIKTWNYFRRTGLFLANIINILERFQVLFGETSYFVDHNENYFYLCIQVQEMDGILGLILKTIEENGLSDVINVIVTSDHGMTSINPKAQVSLDVCVDCFHKNRIARKHYTIFTEMK